MYTWNKWKANCNKTYEMETRPLSNWPITIFIFQARRENVFHDLFSLAMNFKHTLVKITQPWGILPFQKNMHIKVKYDLQFEISYIPCPSSEREEHIKILSGCVKRLSPSKFVISLKYMIIFGIYIWDK